MATKGLGNAEHCVHREGEDSSSSGGAGEESETGSLGGLVKQLSGPELAGVFRETVGFL